MATAVVALLLVGGGCGSPASLYGDNSPITGGSDGGAHPGGDPGVVRCPGSDARLGVPIAARPSYFERLALYAADRARTEPDVSDTTHWGKSYPAVPPLLWDDGLGIAALVHSTDMHDTPCFQHNSCDGTDPFVRIKKYLKLGASTMGENIAAGVNDGQQVVETSWINEVGAAPGTTGHRDNMFSADFNFVGFGYLTGGTQYQGYWTQDFAGAAGPNPFPRLPVGSHYPETGPMVTFGTVYYDSTGGAPDKVEVYVDGKLAAPLALVRGKRDLGAYEAGVNLGAGCHLYRLVATAGGKTVGCYPGTGQLGVGDSLSCPDYK